MLSERAGPQLVAFRPAQPAAPAWRGVPSLISCLSVRLPGVLRVWLLPARLPAR